MKPNHTISNGPVAGTKQSKDRVTILLTSLKGIKKNTLPVNYYWNSKSWMQVSIWNDYLKNLDARIRTLGQNILLLVDNAPTHALYDNTHFTNITIEHLPPNTTAHLQPCDQGVINSFKVKAFDNYNEYSIEPTEINIKKCIKYTVYAWNNITQNTIKNCWLKADILPKNEDNETDMDNETDIDIKAERQIRLTHIEELDEIQELIDKLDFENPFSADEYVQYNDSEITTDMISNEEILKSVLPNNDNDNQEKEIEDLDPLLPLITHNKAIGFYDKIILYLEQQEDVFNIKKEELKFVSKLKKEASKQQFISARQTNLDSFININ
ncbi:unnamed protein product [Rhizophagus irregularis]|nr:unnamed protein product [Rhizophagus irregularis]